MRSAMGKDDDSNSLLYIGIGALAAVGAGYLAWRYLLADDTKDRARRVARTALNGASKAADEAVRTTRVAARNAAAKASEYADVSREATKGVVSRVK